MNCVEEGNDESSKDCRRSGVFAGCYIDRVFRGTAIGLKPNEYGISISARLQHMGNTAQCFTRSPVSRKAKSGEFGSTQVLLLYRSFLHKDSRRAFIVFDTRLSDLQLRVCTLKRMPGYGLIAIPSPRLIERGNATVRDVRSASTTSPNLILPSA